MVLSKNITPSKINGNTINLAKNDNPINKKSHEVFESFHSHIHIIIIPNITYAPLKLSSIESIESGTVI